MLVDFQQVAQRATIAHLRTSKFFLNSSLVSKRFFSIGQGQPTLQSMADQILNSIKGCNSVANLQKKMTLYNPNVDLVNDNVYTKVG